MNFKIREKFILFGVAIVFAAAGLAAGFSAFACAPREAGSRAGITKAIVAILRMRALTGTSPLMK